MKKLRFKIGDRVKALVPTVAGWRGQGTVEDAHPGYVIVRPDGSTDEMPGRIVFLASQVRKMRQKAG